MSCRTALLALSLVLALSGCDEAHTPVAPPPPTPAPVRRPAPIAAAPAPTPLLERTDVPWAPTRYAPALGLLARGGLKVDVDPATGRETLFEVDLQLGDIALRRARTGGADGSGLFGRGWRSELDARLGPEAVALTTQAQLESLHAAVDAVTRQGIVLEHAYQVGGWELVFGAPHEGQALPALYHALMH